MKFERFLATSLLSGFLSFISYAGFLLADYFDDTIDHRLFLYTTILINTFILNSVINDIRESVLSAEKELHELNDQSKDSEDEVKQNKD